MRKKHKSVALCTHPSQGTEPRTSAQTGIEQAIFCLAEQYPPTEPYQAGQTKDFLISDMTHFKNGVYNKDGYWENIEESIKSSGNLFINVTNLLVFVLHCK